MQYLKSIRDGHSSILKQPHVHVAQLLAALKSKDAEIRDEYKQTLVTQGYRPRNKVWLESERY